MNTVKIQEIDVQIPEGFRLINKSENSHRIRKSDKFFNLKSGKWEFFEFTSFGVKPVNPGFIITFKKLY